jgi:EpsI family protein
MPEINDKICVPCTPAHPKSAWIELALVAAAFAFAYAPTVPLLISTWSYPDFSHGFIVPFVSLYLVWARRASLKDLPFEPSWAAGITVTLAGAAILLLGTTGSVVVVEEASIIVMIPGLVLLLLGKRYLLALALPVGYLILMVPVLTPFLEAIYWPLQLVTAKLAGLMLTVVGVSVYQSDQFLELPNISLEVAEACSGAQFLISVLAIAIPLAYISLRGRASRIALLGLAVLITIFSNALRVALIGFLAYVYNKKSALHGPYHILTGYFVFMVGFVFLFISAWVLARFSGKAGGEGHEKKGISGGRGGIAEGGRGFQTAWALALVILVGTGTFVYTYRPVPVPLKKPINELPLSINGWSGTSIIYDADPLKVPGADHETTRIYKNANGKTVKLYIGYLMSQTQDRELIHAHFAGLYDKIEEVDLTLASGDRIRINKAVMREGRKDFLVLFWYDLNGRAVANRYNAKFISAVNGLIHRRTNGAVVILKSEIDGPDGPRRAFGDEEEFIGYLRPILKDYLPSA